jgi:hypothetical protein
MMAYEYGVRTKVYPNASGLSCNEIYAYNNKHSLRSNTKGYGGKTHYTDSQNSDATAPSGRELYNLQFSLQAASPETFGYTLVYGMVQPWPILGHYKNGWRVWRITVSQHSVTAASLTGYLHSDPFWKGMNTSSHDSLCTCWTCEELGTETAKKKICSHIYLRRYVNIKI